ncbi:cysteine desulfurase NifS [soil metagenome]
MSDVYLDHAATTPVDPVVLQAMIPYFTEKFGNPSSIYHIGQDGRAAIETARLQVARALGSQPAEVLFTSGATESNNLAITGVLAAAQISLPSAKRPHIITTSVEHHAVLHPIEAMQGTDISIVPVDGVGQVDPDAIRLAIRPETILISVMLANNEVGTIQPVREISDIAREHGILLHSDAVQAAGHLSVDVDYLGVDLLSLSAHKFYGPKGVGILYLRKGTAITFQQLGGGQEGGRRGGTENVPSIVGLGRALEIAVRDRAVRHSESQNLCNVLWEQIQERIDRVTLNGPPIESRHRLPNNLNFRVAEVQGETVLLGLDMLGVAASAGSACTTGNTQPSHVLTSMGLSVEEARSSVRFSTGRTNKISDIDDAVDALDETVSRIRQFAN